MYQIQIKERASSRWVALRKPVTNSDEAIRYVERNELIIQCAAVSVKDLDDPDGPVVYLDVAPGLGAKA